MRTLSARVNSSAHFMWRILALTTQRCISTLHLVAVNGTRSKGECEMGYFNGSKEGYDKGFSDGVSGRSKASVSSFSQLFSQALHPQSYTESFMDGYREGWADGNRKRNGV